MVVSKSNIIIVVILLSLTLLYIVIYNIIYVCVILYECARALARGRAEWAGESEMRCGGRPLSAGAACAVSRATRYRRPSEASHWPAARTVGGAPAAASVAGPVRLPAASVTPWSHSVFNNPLRSPRVRPTDRPSDRPSGSNATRA